MLSTFGVAFEPDSQKVRHFTSSISALWSGNTNILAEVLATVADEISQELECDPPRDWFSVKEVVDLYVARWGDAKRARATAAYLSTLGLTLESFLDRNRSLDPAVVDKLTSSIVSYSLPSSSCIITGIDHSGAHIWVVTDGQATCHDTNGFAVIGAGQWHAESQMISGKHSQAKTPSETLVLVHMAKKRAEVTPTVGIATDIFLIGPKLGQSAPLSDEYLQKLDERFVALKATEIREFDAAVNEFNQYLATLNGQPEVPQVSGSDLGHRNQGPELDGHEQEPPSVPASD
jgi:hypothetical protein